jgi:tetratricopeptide (TPR) repeat protein
MKLTPRQKKEFLAFFILGVLVVLMVIYQGHLISEYRKKSVVPVLHWAPEQTADDFLQEINNLEKNAAGEKCFRNGTELLKRGRALLDQNLFLEAQKSLECANDAFSTFSTTFNLGVCLFYLEDFPRATDLFRQAHQIRPSACGPENFLGLCMFNTGHWKEGMNHFSSALEKAKKQKKHAWEAVVLSNIGVVFKHMGNLNKAEKYHDLSLALCQKIGYKRGEAGELVNLAHLVAGRGETERERALRIFDNALAAYREIADGRGEASTLSYIARLYREHQDIDNSIKFYQQALKVSRSIGYHLGTAESLMELGTIAYWQKKPDQALSYYLKAKESYQQAGLPETTSTLSGNLGLLYKDKKEYKLALEYYRKALDLDRSTRYLHGEAHDLSQIGLIYELTGQNTKALDAYRQARDLFQSLQLEDRVKEIDNHIQALSAPVSDS